MSSRSYDRFPQYENWFSIVSYELSEPYSEAYSERQKFKIERFAKIIYDFKLSTIFTVHSILDVWTGSE